MMKDEIVTCGICNINKPFSEIVRANLVKGKKVYTCKECYEKIRKIPNNYDFHHQF